MRVIVFAFCIQLLIGPQAFSASLNQAFRGCAESPFTSQKSFRTFLAMILTATPYHVPILGTIIIIQTRRLTSRGNSVFNSIG